MADPVPRKLRFVLLAGLLGLLAITFTRAPALSATSGSVVGATVLTSTSIDTSACTSAGALQIGALTVSSTNATSSPCTVSFGSNGAVRLLIGQRDGVGTAMTQRRNLFTVQSNVPNYRAADAVDADPDNVWVGGNRRIAAEPPPLIHSTDGGATWTSVAVCAAGATASSLSSILTLSSTEVITVFNNNRICRSTDGGATWVPTSLSSGSSPLLSHAPGTDVLYLKSSVAGQLFRSGDRGATWTTVNSPAPTAYADVIAWGTTNVAGIVTTTDTVLETKSASMFVSSDSGATWIERPIATIAASPTLALTGSLTQLARADDGRIVAMGTWAFGARFGTYYTDDNGATWTTMSASPQFWYQLAFIRGTRWIGVNRLNDVKVSSTHAATWITRNAGGTSSDYPGQFAAEPGGRVYLPGDGSKVFRSDDDGDTWTNVTPQFPTYGAIVAFSTDHVAVVASDGSAIRTTDGGATIVSATGCGGSAFTGGVVVNSSTGVVVGGAGKLCRTTDGGDTWQTIASGTADTLRGITRVHKTGELIAWGTTTATILRSVDDGQTWQLRPFSVVSSITRLAIDSDASTIAIDRSAGGRLWVSTDFGATWTDRDLGVTQNILTLAVSPSGARIFTGHSYTALPPDFLTTRSPMSISTDSGATWSVNFHPTLSCDSMTSAFASDSRLWATCGSNAIVSDDGGTTLSQTFGIDGNEPRSLAILDANTVVVGGLNKFLGVSRPVASVPDVVPGIGLTPATGAFGACLAQTDATPDDWLEMGTCSVGDNAAWQPVPAGSSVVLATIASGSASADLHFGLKAASNQLAGDYVADVAFTVVAP